MTWTQAWRPLKKPWFSFHIRLPSDPWCRQHWPSYLRERYRLTGQPALLDRALALDSDALTRPVDPAQRGTILNGVSNSLAFRWARSHDKADIDRLVATRLEALSLAVPGTATHRTCLNNLANALADRGSATGARSDLDRAVQNSEEALSSTPTGSPAYPSTLNNLAGILRERYDVFGDVADADRALELGAEAVSLCQEGGGLWLSAANNYATGLRERFLRRNAFDDLEAAIGLLSQVVAHTPDTSPEAAFRLHNLGNALRARYLRTRELEDLGETIGVYERARGLVTNEADRAALLNDLGSAYNDRHDAAMAGIGPVVDGDLDRVKDCYARAIALAVPGTAVWRTAQSNRGRAILADPGLRTNEAALDEALDAFVASIEKTPAGTSESLIYQANAGQTELLRYEATGDETALRSGLNRLREVARSGLDVSPDQGLIAADAWGRSAMGRSEWHEAAQAFQAGLACLRHLETRQVRRDQKETWLQHAVSMAPRAAYCLARDGRAEDAVQAAEAGRAILLTEALDRRRASASVRDLGEESSASGPEVPPMPPDPHEVTPPLVYVVSGPDDGLALVVRPGGSVDVVTLPGMGERDVLEQVRTYFDAYDMQDLNQHRWHEKVDEVTGWLWTAGIGELIRRLGSARAVLIPTGGLGLLPLHAAWRSEGRAGDARTYAMEEVLFTYAPNARVLEDCRSVSPMHADDGVLVVADPRPSAAQPLPNALEEGRKVRDLFLQGQVLSGTEAKRVEVWRAMAAWPVLHFACHAYGNPADPMESSLLLANDERIRVGDVFEAPHIQPHLVVISACETASVGGQLPDEVVGLPSAFLQAGARGVVATWWPVYDESTSALMTRFHLLLRQAPNDPAGALRAAQLEVRNIAGSDHPVYWAGISYFGA